ncbi:hypothetical protein [Pseudanabaena sp. Chao 1811]|uniref:hypothetical protein n=1 Tax=Pseudanabaena sp. Chao 1811 TaxID=2963092 RepID=UPI0022F3F783|nr:hypothetical protein [Pseudanabaena sp. Chao 1811]
MDSYQETEYVLSNSILMQQIRQFQDNAKKSSINQLRQSIDFEYLVSNPDLVKQIQAIIEVHKQKHHALNCVS